MLLSDWSDYFSFHIKLRNYNLIKNNKNNKNKHIKDLSKVNTKKLLSDATLSSTNMKQTK